MKGASNIQDNRNLQYLIPIFCIALILAVEFAEGQLDYYGSILSVRRTSPITFRETGAQYTATVMDEFGFGVNEDNCFSTSLYYDCLESDGDKCFNGLTLITSPTECDYGPNPLGLGFGYKEQNYLFDLGVTSISRRLDPSDGSAHNTGNHVISQVTFKVNNPIDFHFNVLNQPPQAVMLPLVSVSYGCPLLLEIPIYDSDRYDTVRCELPTDADGCGGICSLSLGITLQSSPCALNIPPVPSQAGSLQEPVSLVIIDTNLHGQDLSRVSLQFTIVFRDAINSQNGHCPVPGFDPSSSISTTGGITRVQEHSPITQLLFYDDRFQSPTLFLTPRGRQSSFRYINASSFLLELQYREGMYRLPQIVCFQYIANLDEIPSRVLCRIFEQGRVRFSRTAIAGTAGERISLLLNIEEASSRSLTLSSSSITANGGAFTIVSSGPFTPLSKNNVQVQFHSNAVPNIEVGMIYIPEVEGPEVLVYVHPSHSTDFIVTVSSVEVLGANENLRVNACRTGDKTIAGIVYFKDSAEDEMSIIDFAKLSSFQSFDPYFKIPIARTCEEFIIPLRSDRLMTINDFTIEFAVEGPLRLDRSSFTITISLPSRCKGTPCLNGGTCSEINELCACPAGFNGIYCEIQPCLPPSVPNCPSDTVSMIISEGSNSKMANYGNISCSDEQQGSIAATCEPAAGSVFNIGSTRVTCTCVDDCGLTSNCVFILIVEESRETIPIWLVVVLSSAFVMFIALLVIMVVLKRKLSRGREHNRGTTTTETAAIEEQCYTQTVIDPEITFRRNGEAYWTRVEEADSNSTDLDIENTCQRNVEAYWTRVQDADRNSTDSDIENTCERNGEAYRTRVQDADSNSTYTDTENTTDRKYSDRYYYSAE